MRSKGTELPPIRRSAAHNNLPPSFGGFFDSLADSFAQNDRGGRDARTTTQKAAAAPDSAAEMVAAADIGHGYGRPKNSPESRQTLRLGIYCPATDEETP